MRTLVNYLRSLFCKHTFEYEDTHVTIVGKNESEIVRAGEKRFIFCPKCGYHKCFWKCFD